jgi:hypothetical protein
LRVDDRFVGGHGRAFGPPAPKVVELHGFTQSCRPVFILGLVYYESRLTGSFANRLGHAEQQLHLAGVHADPRPDRRAVALDIGEKQRHRSGWQKLTQHR